MRVLAQPLVRTLLLGAVLGFLILGIGGRAVMAVITAQAGGSPRFTLGGTLTVVMLGAASGLAGAVMAAMSRAVARRFMPRRQGVEYLILGLSLLLVTMRGLRGTAQAGTEYFYVLVAVFAAALVLTRRRLEAQSHRP